MYEIKNLFDNDDIKVLNTLGCFTVIEYQRDLSVMPEDAQTAYFCSEMNVRRRQVICDVARTNVTTQSGAMQWTVGSVNATTGIKGVGDFIGKALRGGRDRRSRRSSPNIPEMACSSLSRPTST